MYARVVSTADSAVGLPTTIGRYVVLHPVGRGAMGDVYAAYDPKLNRKVAIKILRSRTGAEVIDPDLRLRMVREAQSIAKLSHPNVVVVHDVGAFGNQVFVAMEFVEGQTLSEWVAAEPRGWPEVLKIFADAGRGLAAAHEKNLVHRDFKPDNVMIGDDGQVRVMDFGLARSTTATVVRRASMAPELEALLPDRSELRAAARERAPDHDLEATREVSPVHFAADAPANVASDVTILQITRAGAVMGTPAYMAPEQFESRDTDARTDQFSFCVALYEGLYRSSPFSGRTLEERHASVLRGHVLEPPPGNGVPQWIRKMLLRGLKTDPTERWPSMKALLSALDDNRRFSGRRRLASGAAAKLKGVWEAPARGRSVASEVKAEMRHAFLATGKPYAAAAFGGASRILDNYAANWTAMYVDICEATHVRGEQSPEVLDLRMACLLDCLEDLRALTHLFRHADGGVVQNAVKAANALGNIERCADVDLLREALRPPDDPATRATVERLRAQLASVRALSHVGRYNDGLNALASFEDDVRRVAYGPLYRRDSGWCGAFCTPIAGIGPWRLARSRKRPGRPSCAGTTKSSPRRPSRWCSSPARLNRPSPLPRSGAATRRRCCSVWAATTSCGVGCSTTGRSCVCSRGGSPRGSRMRGAPRWPRRRPAAPAIRTSRTRTTPCHSSWSRAASSMRRLRQVERALVIGEAGFGPQHPSTGMFLSNHAELLNAVGRFEEALAPARRALAIFETETDSNDATTTFPLTALAVACLELGRVDEALPLLERATTILEHQSMKPAQRGEVHFALARALRAGGREPDRARALAARARSEYAQAAPVSIVARALAKHRRLAG